MQFTDNTGREWNVRIDVDTIRRVRSSHAIDLAKVFASRDELAKLMDDIVVFVDVLATVCGEQMTSRGITPEQFGKSLAGDSIDAAIHAFEEAIIEFLPESKRRIIRRIIDGGRASQAQAMLRIENALNSGLIEQGIREQMDKLDRDLATAKSSSLGSATGPSYSESPR